MRWTTRRSRWPSRRRGGSAPGRRWARAGRGRGSGLGGALAAVSRSVLPVHEAGSTRLFVDRVFTLHGIGTVATGTLWSGRIATGDALRAEPAGLDGRGRGGR